MRTLVGCLVVAALTLSGCSSTVSPLKKQAGEHSGTPQWYPDFQRARHLPEDVIAPAQVTALTEKQKAAFRKWYQYPSNQKLTPAEQVVEFLQQSVWGFDFRGDTLVASHAMEDNAGNCLSLALLTAALADEAGVDITFQAPYTAIWSTGPGCWRCITGTKLRNFLPGKMSTLPLLTPILPGYSTEHQRAVLT